MASEDVNKFQTPLSPRRFQSQLGDEYIRNYRTGKDVDRILLARVVKVNYKYNTVDIVTAKDKDMFVKNPNNNGRYSARLPVGFGGKTPEGKVYGTNTLVTVGSLVLVGFLEGSKDSPIVLNIYGEADNQSQLTRTEFSSADESDETVQRELWQLFTLYPSMTYKNVDGRGNQEVTFSGRSFMYITETDPNNEYVNDTAFDYDHLPNSRYANGEQIEPTSPTAPTVLYVHQGVYDDHRVTFFIKSDGTVRVGSRHVNGEGVTFQEMKTDGSFAIVQKKGTENPEEDVQKFSKIEVNDQGHIVLKSRRHDLEITDRGVYVDGQPIGMSMMDEFNRLEKDILDAKTSIGIVDGKIELKANQTSVDAMNDKIIQQEAKLVVAYDEINSKVSRNEIDAIYSGTNNLLTNTHFKTDPRILGDNVTMEKTKQDAVVNSIRLTPIGSETSFGVFVGQLDPVELKPDEEYTLSFEGMFRGTKEINNIQLANGRQLVYKLPNIEAKGDEREFYKYEVTFTLDEPLESKVHVFIGVDEEEGLTEYMEIMKVQLEKGNEATDWNLNYLDFSISSMYETEIKQLADEISLTAKSAKQGINELGEIVDGHTTRIEEAELSIKPEAIVSTVRRSQAYTEDLEAARAYARGLVEEIDVELGTIEGNLSGLGEYIEGAFKDGIIDEAEAQAIEAYVQTLTNELEGLESKYEEISVAKELTGSEELTELQRARTEFKTAHTTLVDNIIEFIGDGKITAQEKADVEEGFVEYRVALKKYHKNLERAVNHIATQKAKEAEGNAKAYTDGKIENVNTEIEQLADEINLRATREEMYQSSSEAEESAREYAKELNSAVIESIDGVTGSLGDLSSYVDGAFKDGIIDSTEAVSIDKYTRLLNIEKSEVDARYNQVYNSTYIKSTPKTELYTSKGEYNTAHDTLLTTIETLVATGTVTQPQKADLDTKFMYYKDALADLTEKIEKAIDSITEEKMERAESNSIEYVDGVAHKIDERLSKAELKIEPSAIISTVTQSSKYTSDVGGLREDLDNLEIGGRNLLRDTALNHEGLGAWNVLPTVHHDELYPYVQQNYGWGVRQIIPLLRAGTYTISTLVKFSGTTDARMRWSMTGVNGIKRLDKTTDWQHVTYTFHLDADVKNFSIYFLNSDTVGNERIKMTQFKLEKGNKATDWSPAPEDAKNYVDGKYTQLESRVSTAEQKILPDAIISTVTQSSKYTSDVGGLRKDLDDMEIGGRNLLSGSELISLRKQTYYTLPITLKAGTYTISFDYNIITEESPITNFLIYSSIVGSFARVPLKEEGKARTSLTFKVTPDMEDGDFYLYAGGNAAVSRQNDVDFIEVQIEEGNRATAWRKSPEDDKAYIDNIKYGTRNYARLTNSEEWETYGANTAELTFEGEEQKIIRATRGSGEADTGFFGIQQSESARIMQLEKGEEYTLSFEVRGKTNLRINYVYLMEVPTPNQSMGMNEKIPSETKFTKMTTTFTRNSDSPNSYLMISAKNIGDVGDWFEIRNVKLEKGNKATDWSPAPEDAKNYVDEMVGESEERVDNIISGIVEDYESQIEILADEINIGVDQRITDLETGIYEEMESKITATSDAIGISIESLQGAIDNAEEDLERIGSYFTFDEDGLNISKSNSPFSLNISNEQMDFMDGDTVVAYINGKQMYIDSLEVLNNVIVGVHQIEKYNDEITMIKWVGDD